MNWLVHLGKSFSFFWGEPSCEFFNQPSIVLLLGVASASWRDKRQRERSQKQSESRAGSRLRELVQSRTGRLEQSRHICRRFPGLPGTGLFQAPIHMEFGSFGREILARGDGLFLEVEGRESVGGSLLQQQAQPCPADAACCCPSCSPAPSSPLGDITVAKPSPANPPSAHLLGSQLDGCETLGRVVADAVDKGGDWVEDDVLRGLDEFNRFLGWHFGKVQPFPDGLVPVQDGWHPRGHGSQSQSPVPIWQSRVAKAGLVR